MQSRYVGARLRLGSAVFCGALALPSVARASGLELMPGGNMSVARGGAIAARAEDPMVLTNDPAGLALLHGQQIILDTNTPFYKMCVNPYGYYGWGVYGKGTAEFGDPLALDDPSAPRTGATYASSPLPEVCNSAPNITIPQLAWAGKITERFAMGAGFVAPVVIPGLQFGGADGTIQTEYGPRPTPTRYSLVKQELTFALGPSVGAGYRILEQLAVGMNVQILMVKAHAIAAQNAVSGTQPSTDWLANLEAHDYFIPSLTFSVHSKPIRPVDLVVAFHWTDSFKGPGQVTYETNTFHRGQSTGPVPYKNDPIALQEVRVGMPWQLTVAGRYAGLLSKKGSLGDPMDSELWDVEVDAGYSLNGLARNTVEVGHDVAVDTRVNGGEGGRTEVEDLPAFHINPHRTTSYVLRAGGSYSIIPREVAAHAGCFYESRGVLPEYADIDTFAFSRIGVGAGVVVRIGSFDLRAGYAHIFSETLEVAPPPHQNVEAARPGDPRSGFDQRVGGSFGPDGTRQGGVTLPDPDAPSPGKADAVARKTQQSAVSTSARPERVINAGRYSAAFDVLSLGVVYHF